MHNISLSPNMLYVVYRTVTCCNWTKFESSCTRPAKFNWEAYKIGKKNPYINCWLLNASGISTWVGVTWIICSKHFGPTESLSFFPVELDSWEDFQTTSCLNTKICNDFFVLQACLLSTHSVFGILWTELYFKICIEIVTGQSFLWTRNGTK